MGGKPQVSRLPIAPNERGDWFGDPCRVYGYRKRKTKVKVISRRSGIGAERSGCIWANPAKVGDAKPPV